MRSQVKRARWLRRRSALSQCLVDLGPKRGYRVDVVGHGVVGEVPSHHACQPLALHGDRQVPASHQLGLDLA